MPLKSWVYVLKRMWWEFWTDHILDMAAGLTYYAMMSIFPGLLALLTTLSLFGQGEEMVAWLLDFLGSVLPPLVVDLVADPIRNLATVTGAGFVFTLSLLIALWSASGYIAAFGRAMNRIYQVVEGRPVWMIIPYNLALTLLMLLVGALASVAIGLSAEVVDLITLYVAVPTDLLDNARGLRWVWVALAGLLLVMGLYRLTPNVRQPHLRWTALGASLTVGLSLATLFGFSAGVAAFGRFNATYGIIGSFIVLLLGLFLINVVTLLGAEFNAEIERVRQLRCGLHAEDAILLPPRATRMIHAHSRTESRLLREAISLRIDGMIALGYSGVDADAPASPSPSPAPGTNPDPAGTSDSPSDPA